MYHRDPTEGGLFAISKDFRATMHTPGETNGNARAKFTQELVLSFRLPIFVVTWPRHFRVGCTEPVTSWKVNE
jgi:hypothetical protein